jgi:uncharacterized protein YigA (DUF484 family)
VNKSLQQKLTRYSSTSQTLITEEAILNSKIFKKVLEQAQSLSEEASKADSLSKELDRKSKELTQCQKRLEEFVHSSRRKDADLAT